MIRVKFLKNEPNSVPIGDLGCGHLFKTQRGQTVYIIIEPRDDTGILNLEALEHRVAAVSLDSGTVHAFSDEQPVVELNGTLEVSRIVIRRN